jgi:hypothetical protein
MRTLGILISTIAVALAVPSSASAAIVPTVPVATAGNYSVLGAETVTNTGPSTLNASLGVSPGTSITGFPPGIVNAPGVTNITNAAAAQAQLDLTAAYNNAAGRPVDATTTADLSGLILQGGVYAGPSAGALALTGTLTLDAAGDPTTVFIFTTDSTLITGSSSVVSLINGAQACNVFWRVGSSATLGSSSVMVGTIMANVSITLNDSVTVHGRALARTGAVTLINDTFTAPSCNLSVPTATTAAGAATTAAGAATTAAGAATTAVGATATTVTRATTNSTLPPSGAASTAKGVLIGIVLGVVGLGAGLLSRRRPAPTR